MGGKKANKGMLLSRWHPWETATQSLGNSGRQYKTELSHQRGRETENESFNTSSSEALADAASGCIDRPALLRGLRGELLVQWDAVGLDWNSSAEGMQAGNG